MKIPALIALALSVVCGLSYGVTPGVRQAMPSFVSADPQVSEVYAFWQNYLDSHPDSTYDSPFWNQLEKTRYEKADLFRSWYLSPALYSNMQEFAPHVLGISREGEYFKIRTLFSH